MWFHARTRDDGNDECRVFLFLSYALLFLVRDDEGVGGFGEKALFRDPGIYHTMPSFVRGESIRHGSTRPNCCMLTASSSTN